MRQTLCEHVFILLRLLNGVASIQKKHVRRINAYSYFFNCVHRMTLLNTKVAIRKWLCKSGNKCMFDSALTIPKALLSIYPNKRYNDHHVKEAIGQCLET